MDTEQERFAAGVRAGLADLEAGRVVSEQDALRHLELVGVRKPRAKRTK